MIKRLLGISQPDCVIMDISTGEYYSAPNTPGTMFSPDPSDAYLLYQREAVAIRMAMIIDDIGTGSHKSTAIVRL